MTMQNIPFYLKDDGAQQYVAWQSDQVERQAGLLAFMGGQCMIQPMKDGRWHIMNGPLGRWQIVDQLDMFDWQVLKAFCSLGEADQQRMRIFMTQRADRFSTMLHVLPQNNVSWKNSFLIAFSKMLQECEA
ncbi:MAG: hypothetical protein RL106_1989 [Bacteroidota bacterium]